MKGDREGYGRAFGTDVGVGVARMDDGESIGKLRLVRMELLGGRVAQLVRAPRLHRGGPGFESLRAHHVSTLVRADAHQSGGADPPNTCVGAFLHG